MKFDELSKGDKILLDANIFIYHFTGTSEECSKLLKKCEEGEVEGTTTVTVILEALHRLMAVEAVRKGLVSGGNVVRKLKEKPEVVKELSEYYENIQRIKNTSLITIELLRSLMMRNRIEFTRHAARRLMSARSPWSR
jgi:predicted nucleic acid-binding protein